MAELLKVTDQFFRSGYPVFILMVVVFVYQWRALKCTVKTIKTWTPGAAVFAKTFAEKYLSERHDYVTGYAELKILVERLSTSEEMLIEKISSLSDRITFIGDAFFEYKDQMIRQGDLFGEILKQISTPLG
jgi:K+-transporting ATPase c subunit